MNNRNNQNQDPEPPEKLRAALSRLNARRVMIPPKVDDAILRAAREHLHPVADELRASQKAGSVERLSKWSEWRAGVLELLGGWRLAALSAVAVAIVAAGALVWLGGHTRLAARNEDLNGDGVVDVLDAFALARELQQGQTPRPQLDLNGDGVVDERDVQILAARAVSLEAGGRS
jgi:hypothetical protein